MLCKFPSIVFVPLVKHGSKRDGLPHESAFALDDMAALNGKRKHVPSSR